ncbi:MAG: proton-conducting transporter membrane subunit [Thermoleophilaceae bacterium]
MLAAGLGMPWLAATVLAALDGRRRWGGWLAVGALAAGLAAVVLLGLEVLREGPVTMVPGGWPAGVGIRLRADSLGVLFAALSLVVLLAALSYEVIGGVDSRTFPAVVLFMAAGLTGLFLTGDVFSFYVFFEISMISAYVLTAYGEARQAAAGFIFAVVNLLGSFLFLIGVASLYHVTGTLEMEVIATRIAEVEANTAVLIAVAIFVAFGVKLGLFPFHFWLPAVYIGSRPATATILSGALANIGSYGVLRFGADVLSPELRFGATVILVLGAASILYGALQAVSRRSAGEVLAYSTIGQVGYVLVALGIGGPVGFGAAVLYAVVNALNKTLLFLANGLRGWLVGGAFAVGAFSVVGVPPTAGFFGKVALFQAGIEARSGVLVGLVFLGGALSFIYMFQIYQHDFWRGERTEEPITPGNRALVAGLAAILVGLGLWPEPLLAVSSAAAESLR